MAPYPWTTLTTSHSQFPWILDGSSTTHICKDISAFLKLALTWDTIGSIQKKGPKLDIHRIGDICIIFSIKGCEDRIITLWDVTYCPDAWDNLISESQMDHKGLEIHKQNRKVSIIKGNSKIVIQGSLQGGLYVLYCILAPNSAHQSDVVFSAHYECSLDCD